MRKNVASQVVSAHLVSKTDGSDVTSGTTTVYYNGNGGTQAAGGSTATHEGNGEWSYVPAQAETNYNQVAFTFVNTSAVSVTVNCYPVAYDPTDSVRAGLTALPNVASGNSGAIPTVGTGTGQISLSSGQVILQTGTGTGQLDFTSGVVKANTTQLGGSSTPVTNLTTIYSTDYASIYDTTNKVFKADTTRIAGSAVSTSTAQIGVNVVNAAGTAWGSGAITAASIATDAITAAKIATDAGTEIATAVWASGTRTLTALGSGVITSSTFATGAIDAAALAADAGTEIGTAVWASTTRALTSTGLDAISTTAPSGVASNFREMVVQTWRMDFKKSTMSATQLKTYADDGTTVVTTQTIADSGTLQTRGAAS